MIPSADTADALALAWIVVVVGAVWLLGRGLRRHRGEVAAFAGVTALAAAVYLALPWGPLDFSEAERLSPLWSDEVFMPAPFGGGLLALLVPLHRAGLPTGWILRGTGPALGALGVGMTWLLARRAGLRRGPSLLAAGVVLTWPAYAHHATSVGLTIAGAALWTAVFALASARTVPAWGKLPLLAALVTLGIWTRPEYRLLLVALPPLLFTPGWTWRRRVAMALLLAPGLLSYLGVLSRLRGTPQPTTLSVAWLHLLRTDLPMNAPWWIVVGALGLVAGRGLVAVRVAALLAVALLCASYWNFASEPNPLWGLWRGYVSVVPFLGLGAGLLAGRLPDAWRWRRAALGLGCAVALATLLGAWSTLRRPLDLQRESAYLRELGPRLFGRQTPLLIFRAHAGTDDERGVPPEPSVLLALSASGGATRWPRRCDQPPLPSSDPPVLDLEDFALRCPQDIPTGALVYVGLFRPSARFEAVRARLRLVPVDERRLRVTPSVPLLNTQCPLVVLRIYGSALADCDVTVGWYRVTATP